MIQINKSNKTAVIDLHKSIYNEISIKESAAEFIKFGSFGIDNKSDYHVVNVKFNDNVDFAEYEKVCLEFCNYLFVLMKNKNEI